jgi:two-component system, cell cycle response regulator DivK
VQRFATGRILQKAGCTVLNAADGEEALRMGREDAPDAVLLDMMLPKLGGLQVLRELKAGPVTAHIPVIALTSLSEANEAKLRDAGVDGFFCKTNLFDDKAAAEHFLQLVERVLNAAQKHNANAAAPAV